MVWWGGKSSYTWPSNRYDVQIRRSGSPDRTSSLVTNSSVSPFSLTAYLRSTASSQPHRRGRPVTVPNSCPRSPICFPAAAGASVGKGAEPTRVTYAFATPTTEVASTGPSPAPDSSPPATQLEEVTNGYVPWSRSRSVPCAPSSRTCLPSRRDRYRSEEHTSELQSRLHLVC